MAVKYRSLAFLALLWWVTPVPAQELRPFEGGTYQAILDARGERPFVLAFWSIDCPPCYGELKMLGEQLQSIPFDLVLVSTDTAGSAPEIGRLLTRFGLERTEAWIFSAPPEQLRFEVDRTWYGELPRSYLFWTGRREAVSGALTAAALKTWLARQRQ
jgi:thiol-disulfide isomerase/thioredoxin